MNLPEKKKLSGIISALSQKDCILFIGSGVSLWSDLPSWHNLIIELSEYVKKQGESNKLILKELRNGDLLQAASYGLDKLTNSQIADFYKQACRVDVSSPSSLHKKIVELGPRSFITTNYDTLLEDSLSKWSQRNYLDIVTNKQLIEMAGILNTNARDFIYKFHGDIRDIDSIILTREQYRILLPQGERYVAMETLKHLLVSRPVVYIGFGLRDPDFLYLKDILINTYQGSTRDHYAIMPDIDPDETSFWRNEYGIHLISYVTSENGKDHSQLLELIDSLKDSVEKEKFSSNEIEYFYSLMRYASTLSYVKKNTSEFIIYVSNDLEISRFQSSFDSNVFFRKKVDDFLEEISDQALLVGSAGSGKTFSFKQTVSNLGSQMLKTLANENTEFSSVVLPVYIDLKMYTGSLDKLFQEALPNSAVLKDLDNRIRLKIFIDSFNETPKKFRESHDLIEDIQQFINNYPTCTIVISSRSKSGLESLNLPTFHLNEIDNKTIDNVLKDEGIIMAEKWRKETYQLLKKPLFFQYFISKKIDIKNIEQPKDFYEQIFFNLQNDFTAKFNEKFDITNFLSLLAYGVIDDGNEAFHQDLLYNELSKKDKCFSDNDFINWLISQNIIVSHTEKRISFVHQSITEYLAAIKFAIEYQKDSRVLRAKAGLYRWDQAIFLALNLLPSSFAKTFIEELINIDFSFAIDSLKYAEINHEEITEMVLEIIYDQKNSSISRQSFKWDFPVTHRHELILRKIVESGDTLGGLALERLVTIKGASIKKDLENLLLTKLTDFNFGLHIGRIVSDFINETDVEKLFQLTKHIDSKYHSTEDVQGFIQAIPELCSKVSLDVFSQYFLTLPPKEMSEIMLKIVTDRLYRDNSPEAFVLLVDILGENSSKPLFGINMMCSQKKIDIPWEYFTEEHVEVILDSIENNTGQWGLKILSHICKEREDLKYYILYRLPNLSPQISIFINSIITGDQQIIFDYFEKIIENSIKEIDKPIFNLIPRMYLDWDGHDQLFLDLIEHCDVELINSILGHTYPTDIKGLHELPIKSIYTYLDLLANLNNVEDSQISWYAYEIAFVLTKFSSIDIKEQFLREINNDCSPYKEVLFSFIMPYLEFDINSYDDHVIDYALSDLSKSDYSQYLPNFHTVFLVETATESFTEEFLLPLMYSDDKSYLFKKNLFMILSKLGEKFGKRYLINNTLT